MTQVQVGEVGVGSDGLSLGSGKRVRETESHIPERREKTRVPDLSSLDLFGAAADLSGAGMKERTCHEHQPGQMRL
jgi:hypothetical protein